jgi:3-phosphoshikimate 1-carboxyvinyltransferase
LSGTIDVEEAYMTELDLTLAPVEKIPEISLYLPGSKSIANRALLLAALAQGKSILHNVPKEGEDVQLMISALKELGIPIIAFGEAGSYLIEGCCGIFPVKKAEIFCGNAGTVMRFLAAVLALGAGHYHLTCVDRMKERPIGDLIASLVRLGADIEFLEKPDYPPLKIGPFSDSRYSIIDCGGKNSSQYVSALLIACALLKREISIHVKDHLVSQSYVEMTVNLLNKFSIPVEAKKETYKMWSFQTLRGIEYSIEPDASSASYFLAAAAINGKVTVKGIGKHSIQGDSHFAEILSEMGAKVIYDDDEITVSSSGLIKPIDMDMNNMPDTAMTLGVLCLFANGVSRIRGIATWKIKETDRLKAMHTELSKLGASVFIDENSITIIPPERVNHGVCIDTYDDHRMAMAFSLVAVYGVEVTIKNHSCVCKTFPQYFSLFKKLFYEAYV